VPDEISVGTFRPRVGAEKAAQARAWRAYEKLPYFFFSHYSIEEHEKLEISEGSAPCFRGSMKFVVWRWKQFHVLGVALSVDVIHPKMRTRVQVDARKDDLSIPLAEAEKN